MKHVCWRWMWNCPLLWAIIIIQACDYSCCSDIQDHGISAWDSLKLDVAQRQHMRPVIPVNLVFLFAKPLVGKYCRLYRNRSCPAVSQICSLTVFPPTLTTREPNSTPMVWLESCLTATRTQREEWSRVTYFGLVHGHFLFFFCNNNFKDKPFQQISTAIMETRLSTLLPESYIFAFLLSSRGSYPQKRLEGVEMRLTLSTCPPFLSLQCSTGT